MPLSDTAIKNAKATDKPYKIPDEKNMYLLVQPNGSKYFRLKYRFAGKEKMLALGGIYPDTSLKQAREKRDEARTQFEKPDARNSFGRLAATMEKGIPWRKWIVSLRSILLPVFAVFPFASFTP